MTAQTYSPPHGGYPTPCYNQVPVLRKAVSRRLFGHTGAFVYSTVKESLDAAAYGKKAS